MEVLMRSGIRRFHLQRAVDESGVSGTGRVAEGVQFKSGWCGLVWLTKHTSSAFYTSLEDVKAIHGHGGKTVIAFDDCAFCPHPADDHWMDNCGGCANASCGCTAMGWPREENGPCTPERPCWFQPGMGPENYCESHRAALAPGGP